MSKELAKKKGEVVKKDERSPTEFFMSLITADDEDHILSIKNVEKFKNAKTEEEKEIGTDAVMVLGVDNGHALFSTIDSTHYRRIALRSRRKLIKEFDCKNTAEKMLVDNIVSSYIQFLSATSALNRNVSRDEVTISKDWNDYRESYSKDIDRANRRFISAYQTLVQLKQPPLNVSVNTKNAFVAQAQQFNAKDVS